MNLASPYRILKTCTIYYILIWINLLDGQPLNSGEENHKNLTDCALKFETNVQQCLDGLYFYKWNTDTMKFQTSNFFKEILKRFLCRQYTNSLQCVHELLDNCKQYETSQTVRQYLRQPWARQYNTFCDINNQQHSSILVRNNSSEAIQHNASSNQRSNLVRNISTEARQNTSLPQKQNAVQNSTINTKHNSTKERKRPMKLHEKEAYSETNDNHFITGKPDNQLSDDHAGNNEKILPKDTLFFLKSAKTNNNFQTKEVRTVEYETSLRKVETVSMKIVSQTKSVKDNQRRTTVSQSQYEVQFEIH